jgi:hypothetical protein
VNTECPNADDRHAKVFRDREHREGRRHYFSVAGAGALSPEAALSLNTLLP